jgi:hypothetical protein
VVEIKGDSRVGVGTGMLYAGVSMSHASGSFVTRKTMAWHVAQKSADMINATGGWPLWSGPERRDARAGLGERTNQWRHHAHVRDRVRIDGAVWEARQPGPRVRVARPHAGWRPGWLPGDLYGVRAAVRASRNRTGGRVFPYRRRGARRHHVERG